MLDKAYRPVQTLPQGLDVGAASLVRVSGSGLRIAVAVASGTVRMLDAGGKELWQTDLNKAARPGDKPWIKNQKAEKLAPGVWCTNGGLAHSDLGRQILIEAPQGLVLIDPNSAASFEQNWARIQAAGFDPMQVKYVLPTHEHGDHAPGATLWRVVTGARVMASAEMAYILQHHIPGGTGYGLHPPVPVDIVLTEDQDLDLAGLKVKAIRLPGHTSGSMGHVFQKNGRTIQSISAISIMPGGVLGYAGNLDFSALEDVLNKLATLKPDLVLGGQARGGGRTSSLPRGIEAVKPTGWSKMRPPKPDPFCRFGNRNQPGRRPGLEPIVAVHVTVGRGDDGFQPGRHQVVPLPEAAKRVRLRRPHLRPAGGFAGLDTLGNELVRAASAVPAQYQVGLERGELLQTVEYVFSAEVQAAGIAQHTAGHDQVADGNDGPAVLLEDIAHRAGSVTWQADGLDLQPRQIQILVLG